jgi:peptide/nickel transport system ATP-binding protein
MLLEIKNLNVEFDTENGIFKAIDGVEFSINKGETIGIVGESGSGKSVTSLSVMRLISSNNIKAGEILFTDNDKTVDLLKLKGEEMRKFRGNKIAMIFQEPMTSLNPVYTCGKQVMEVIILHEKLSKTEAKAKTIALFQKVQLPRPESIFETYPHQISGGQKQRVMIAMAIACNPALLIADEPTTALDVTVQQNIIELLKELQKEFGMGIIFISHDLGVIADIADKVAVMYKGKVVEKGFTKDILTNPQHPYTKGLLACRPTLTKRLRVLPTVNDFLNPDRAVELQKMLSDKNIITESERAEDHKMLYSKEPLLRINNLKTYFPVKKGLFGRTKDYVKAVDNISLDVYPGETLGLVGESGCGKSTLGRSVLRLIEPTDGSIIYENKNIKDLDSLTLRNLRKDIQIIFQDPYSSLNPRITVGNAIIEPMMVHKILLNDKERKAYVLELLKKVGLQENHFNRYPYEFSGGQRQRICIARALALSPKFIICDESVSALDVSVQAQVLNLLNKLKQEFGFTYIFISHDLSVVKFMSDRMIVMNKGKIEEEGNPDEIYINPKADYTKRLINAIPKGL